jgi:hypothetical protein
MSVRSLCAFPLLLGLLTSAVHAADAPACRYVPVATLQLRGVGDVWQPTVEGTINGKPAVMLFDTGAHASRLVKDSAEKLGIALQQASGYSTGIGGVSLITLPS